MESTFWTSFPQKPPWYSTMADITVQPTDIEGVLVIQASAFEDHRGSLMEIHHARHYEEKGLDRTFVQDNVSLSRQHVLRGLHFQVLHPQAKLVQVLKGAIYDVVVDVRPESSSFGRWVGVTLDDHNRHQLYVPEGFAHGFCVLSSEALVYYKCTEFYVPGDEGAILWSDPDVGIEWPVENPILSDKDKSHPLLRDVPPEKLPAGL